MIAESEVVWYLSGGAGNTAPAASLGGAISGTLISNKTLSGLFGDVTAAQAAAGITRYRCFYVRLQTANALGLLAPIRTWIATQAAGDDSFEIGLDPAGKNAAAATIVNQTTAPAGVTFSAPTSDAAGLELPGAPWACGDYAAIWVKDVVPAEAAALVNDTATLSVAADTA
jgi:hypothetical protein